MTIQSPNKQPIKQCQQSVRAWFLTGKGRRLLSLEEPLIDKALGYYFGRFLIQAGPLYNLSQPIKDIDQVVSLGCHGTNADIVCEEKAWPILTEGVEAVVLHHSLDFAHSPHNVLREAARCIRPGGHLLIVGFNPYSYWGIYRRCHFGTLSKSHGITYGRLLDWLKLLGFAVEHKWTGGYGFPHSVVQEKITGWEAIGQRRKWWGNGFYIVSARKMMIQPTPSKTKKKSILDNLAPIPVVNRNDVKVNE